MEAGIKICEVVGEVVWPTKTKLFDAGNFISLQVSISTILSWSLDITASWKKNLSLFQI